MALSVVATVGASTANSYDTVANADSYFEAHPDWATWDKLNTSEKGRYMILATRMIDAENIDGDKYDTTTTSGVPDQALRFPRAVDYLDGTLIIPVPVKHATYEQAVYLAKSGTNNTRAELQAQGVRSVSIGDVTETYGGNPEGWTQLCKKARKLLVSAGIIRLSGTWA